MTTVTLSSKNQITLPAAMVRALGLKAGDKLDVELINDRLVIWPKPQSYADYFIGSMKGYWGTAEEIDRYVAEERASWERDEDYEQAWAFLNDPRDVLSGVARQIRDGLSRKPSYQATHREVKGMVLQNGEVGYPEIMNALKKMRKLKIVRQRGEPGGEAWNNVQFWLDPRFALVA